MSFQKFYGAQLNTPSTAATPRARRSDGTCSRPVRACLLGRRRGGVAPVISLHARPCQCVQGPESHSATTAEPRPCCSIASDRDAWGRDGQSPDGGVAGRSPSPMSGWRLPTSRAVAWRGHWHDEVLLLLPNPRCQSDSATASCVALSRPVLFRSCFFKEEPSRIQYWCSYKQKHIL